MFMFMFRCLLLRPSWPNVLHFHAVFGQIGRIVCWCQPPAVADRGFSKWGGAVLSQMGGAHPVFR